MKTEDVSGNAQPFIVFGPTAWCDRVPFWLPAWRDRVPFGYGMVLQGAVRCRHGVTRCRGPGMTWPKYDRVILGCRHGVIGCRPATAQCCRVPLGAGMVSQEAVGL